METVCRYKGDVMCLLRGMITGVALLVVMYDAEAQKPSAADQILLNVEQRMFAVKDYIVDIQADVDMERMKIPRMQAKMYFKHPNKVHFESPSFTMLPREGLTIDPAAMREHYDVSLAGSDDLGEGKATKLQLAAKKASTRLRQMFVWVDERNWTIVRMQTIPYQGRVLTMSFAYTLLEGRYWMPQSMKAEFEAPDRDTTGRGGDPAATPTPQLDERQRSIRSGMISVIYSNYRINTGLGDEIFERKDVQKKD
ncbi:MAG: hypothetical protein WEE20_15655 [Bacteroidota bacterium]